MVEAEDSYPPSSNGSMDDSNDSIDGHSDGRSDISMAYSSDNGLSYDDRRIMKMRCCDRRGIDDGCAVETHHLPPLPGTSDKWRQSWVMRE